MGAVQSKWYVEKTRACYSVAYYAARDDKGQLNGDPQLKWASENAHGRIRIWPIRQARSTPRRPRVRRSPAGGEEAQATGVEGGGGGGGCRAPPGAAHDLLSPRQVLAGLCGDAQNEGLEVVKETLEIEKKEKEMNVCKAKFAERKRKYAVVFNKAINGAKTPTPTRRARARPEATMTCERGRGAASPA